MSDTGVKPLRLRVPTVAKLLDVTPNMVNHLIKSGTLTAVYPTGKGNGKKPYLNPGEVEAYALSGVEGVVDYRRKQAKRKSK